MKEIIPITPSTGGAVSPNDIVGRDKEIDSFWSILRKQGIALFAERRFGKSSILRKMEADGQKGFIPIYKPIEGISSPENVAAVLLDRVKEMSLIDEGLFKILENFYNKTTELVEEVKGIKLKKLEYTWQKQLFYLFKKLIEKHKDKKIVIMLDEFSIFLDELKKDEASNVIGFFRNITFEKEFKNIRFVYCGSIGIDLVLDKIKKDGHNIGDPLNHMYKHELQPFTDDNAKYFGKCLNLGCKLKIPDELIEQICSRANNIPYFIDIVFDKISKAKEANQKAIDNAFEEILDDTKGKESIKHFYDRIENFYPNYKLSVYILNYISLSTQAVTEMEIANNVLTNTTETDRIEINEEIERLRNDGYLFRIIKGGERLYDFKYSLLKLWWKINKAY
jgi:predicted regulator of amino acid metabolism with ACT domain